MTCEATPARKVVESGSAAGAGRARSSARRLKQARRFNTNMVVDPAMSSASGAAFPERGVAIIILVARPADGAAKGRMIMKPERGTGPAGEDQVETYGNGIQRFESTFQPRKKPPSPPLTRTKGRDRVEKP